MRIDFRSVQARHEKARRQLNSGEGGSGSSIHYSSPSQTYVNTPATSGLQSAAMISNPSKVGSGSSMRRKGGRVSLDSGHGSVNRMSGLSPLNPKRGTGSGSAGGSGSTLVGIGGAVASMNGSVGLGVSATNVRTASPPPGGKKRILGGIRRTGG